MLSESRHKRAHIVLTVLPLIWNIQNRRIYRDKNWLPAAAGGEWRVTADGDRISF